MSLIGYARVSTSDQNPLLQLDALDAAGCLKVFSEEASGSQADRPQLKAALDYLRPGDSLVVWKLDRLARSLTQLIATIEAVHHAECGFRSLTETIDTTTPSGRLVFHIFGALTEFERSIIRERTLAGLKSARARGRRGGRPPLMNDQKRSVAETLLRDGKLTVKEVADQIGVSDSTLYKHFPSPRTKQALKACTSVYV